MSGELSDNPFVRYRAHLDAHQRWLATGGTDTDYVELVDELDAKITAVDGRGFHMTPLSEEAALGAAAGLGAGARLWVKNDSVNVGGSHKARHLFGLLLHAAADAREGGDADRELAIASCGNAAIGAAVVAKAAGRRLRVFIPEWADEVVASMLDDLGAHTQRCPRVEGESGDPCVLRFQEAVDGGSVPFSVQGSIEPRALDGGVTLGLELAEQLAQAQGAPAQLDVIAIQVGGGALGASVGNGLRIGVSEGWLASMPRLSTVQTEACAPLRRAWNLLRAEDNAAEAIVAEPERFMWPWEDVGTSAADGILDDVTYDWVPLTRHMADTGGSPVVVSEPMIVEAHRLAHEHTDIDVSSTGSAGLAGILSGEVRVEPGDHVAVLFTGVSRGESR